MKTFLFAAILIVFQSKTEAQNIFHWKWELLEAEIKITGKLNDGKETVIFCESVVTKKRFERLYRIIDEIEYKRLQVYQRTVDTLSNQLVLPFAKELKESNSIIVDIDSSLLNFAIEFIKIKNESIALFRPLVFKINDRINTETSDIVILHKGYIVRDPTSDPENACINIYRQYPSSEFKSAYKIFEKDLTIKPGIDFILISAHGDADSITFKGGIALNKIDNVSGSFFKENNPAVVYIDGCQQGVNWTYISALAETDESNFYLGPIVSNDSGESSTKTINWFFSYLRNTHNPIISIWKTRNRLYKHYNQKINKMDVINKSFIFRIYKV
jgi:hypothetical protein